MSPNKKRSLDVIGAELRKLRNIFDSGKLLAEAQEACEHGEWLDWLETYFDASEDTAERHIAAYHLSLKFRNLRNLQVPTTIIYQLADFEDDSDLPTIIKALAEISKLGAKGKLPCIADCERVIEVTVARLKWGNDLPVATLDALDSVDRQDEPWSAGAIKQLRRERPDTAEAARKIVDAHHEKFLDKLCKDPPKEDGPDDVQDTTPQPKPISPSPRTEETSREQAAAAAAANNDIGTDSKAESSRRQAVIDDLANERNKLKIDLEGRNREIARLEGEIEKLKAEPVSSVTDGQNPTPVSFDPDIAPAIRGLAARLMQVDPQLALETRRLIDLGGGACLAEEIRKLLWRKANAGNGPVAPGPIPDGVAEAV
jgi:Protein of unknown function (DUF3102)